MESPHLDSLSKHVCVCVCVKPFYMVKYEACFENATWNINGEPFYCALCMSYNKENNGNAIKIKWM